MADIPRFLFAGQSNMVGHSEQALNGLFKATVKIVNERFFIKEGGEKRERRRQILADLEDVIGNAQDALPGSSTREAELIYELAGARRKSKSVLNNSTIFLPHSTAVCSFTDPSSSSNLNCEGPVSPTACGGGSNIQFGPELMFAHRFSKLNTKYKKKPFGITKVARGGTRISQWTKPREWPNSSPEANLPNYWLVLQKAIKASSGTIEAFVWFQGENDHFPQTSREDYLESLIMLVADVRKEIFAAYKKISNNDETDIFQAEADIPVVIVELGSWIGNGVSKSQGNEPGNVIVAQREFVNKM